MSLAALKGPGEVEAEVLMSRTAFNGAFLIVEGTDDSRFFCGRVDESVCEIVIAGGKPAVVGGVERLNNKAFCGALGIVDDDCDSVDGRHLVLSNLIATSDARDLDALLIWSPALERVLAEYADMGRVRKLGGIQSVHERLVELALPFGSLRRWSYAASVGLDFKSLRPFRFVTPNWTMDPTELYLAAAAQLACEHRSLVSEVDRLPRVEPRLICHGHDLIAILAIGLTKGGILGSASPGSDTIASALRLALDSTSWRTSRLAQNIVGWEASNAPFRVLSS